VNNEIKPLRLCEIADHLRGYVEEEDGCDERQREDHDNEGVTTNSEGEIK